MKILFMCENYLPHYGGVEVVFKNLSEGHVKQGHEVTLLTQKLRNTKSEESIGGVKVKRIYSFFTRYLFTFFAIPKAIYLAREHDIIQTTTFNGAFPAWLAGKLTGKKVVLTVHEVWVNKWKQVTDFSNFKCKLHDLLERTIYLLPFDKYVCVSEATKTDLLKRAIKENKVEVVHNGLDYNFWNSKNIIQEKVQSLRNDLGKDKFIYFSWGRSGESKGFEYAIKAVPEIAKKIPNSVFVLMLGSVDKYQKKYQQLIDLIKSLNLKDKIKLIPSVPYVELREYIQAADCIVIPSLAEGFGYTTVESVAMGKPVVVSDAGSLPEVVSGKYNIFINKNHTDLANNVIKLAKGEFQQKELKKFEWKTCINKYLQIYSQLLKKES